MKTIALLLSIVISVGAICQPCPQSGLKIQSSACEDPKNLAVKTLTCTQMNVQWRGVKNQTYVVNATCTDPITKTVTEAEVSNISCKDNGNCAATVAVKDGSIVHWSVSAVCKIDGSTMYSNKVEGKEVNVPVCKNEGGTKTAFHIYPNPSHGDISVVFENFVPKNAGFRVYDVNGKKVFSTTANALQKLTGTYQLDLHHLPDGVYLLEVGDGKNKSTAKFEIIKK